MSDTSVQNDTAILSHSPIPVGCDDGYADIKIVYERRGKLIEHLIPARARVGQSTVTSTSGEVGKESYSADDLLYTVNPYLDDYQDTRFKAYPTSALNRVLVHHGLCDAGLGGQPISLLTGLPPGRYYHKRGGFHSRLLKAKKQNLTGDIRAADGHPLADIRSHLVFSQAAAAVFDWCVDDTGGVVRNVNEPLVVVDIGGRTTDFLTLLPPGDQVDHDRSDSSRIGVLDVMASIEDWICDEHDMEDISPALVAKALSTGTVRLSGQDIDVNAAVENAVNEVSEKIIAKVRATVSNTDEIDTILFIGGGAEVLRPVISQYPQATVLERPQFANARGMFKYQRVLDNQNAA